MEDVRFRQLSTASIAGLVVVLLLIFPEFQKSSLSLGGRLCPDISASGVPACGTINENQGVRRERFEPRTPR